MISIMMLKLITEESKLSIDNSLNWKIMLGMKVTGLLELRFDKVLEARSGLMARCMKGGGWTTRPMELVD